MAMRLNTIGTEQPLRKSGFTTAKDMALRSNGFTTECWAVKYTIMPTK